MIHWERGEGITNDKLETGMELVIIGIKATKPWYHILEGFSCWNEVFRNIGLENVTHVHLTDLF